MVGMVPRNPLPPQTTILFGGAMVLEWRCFVWVRDVIDDSFADLFLATFR